MDAPGAILVVTVTARGDVVVSDRGAEPVPIDEAALETRFRIARARDPDTRIVVIAEPEVASDRVYQLLDRAKLLGLSRFAIGLDPTRTHELDTPTAASADMARAVVSIRIPGNQDVIVNGEAVEGAALGARLGTEAARDPRPVVLVITEGVVSAGRLIAIMDHVKRAGFTQLAIGRVASP